MRTKRAVFLFVCLLACSGCGRKSTGELIKDLKSSKERDRLFAVRTLPERKGDAAQVVPALIEALKDSHGDVRQSAAIGLGYYGEKAKDAVPALEEARRDHDGRVREAARNALTRIDPNQFPPPGAN